MSPTGAPPEPPAASVFEAAAMPPLVNATVDVDTDVDLAARGRGRVVDG